MCNRMNGAADKFCTIVIGDNLHPLWQGWLDFFDFRFNPIYDSAGVFTDQQHNDAGDSLTFAVMGHRALPQHRRECDFPEVAHIYWHSVMTADDDVAYIGKVCNEASAANYLLLTVVNDISAASAEIVFLE